MYSDKFDNNVKKAIYKAFNIAKATGCEQVLPAHLLLALIKQKGTIANELLSPKSLESKILDTVSKHKSSETLRKLPTLSLSTEEIVLRAAKTAFENKHPFIGTEHLFHAIISDESNDLKEIFSNKINRANIKTQLKARFSGISRFPEIRDMFNFFQADMPTDIIDNPAGDKKQNLLEFFAVDLTDPKNQKKFMPLIGREKEISQLIQILCRKNKNNPLLLGEPGVGKTALVEGLAQRILEGKTPDILADKKIMALDLGSLVAGTMYRGDFESRVKQILEEIKSDPKIILFIDEIHAITGAGSASGALDAANLFKPLLARGELRCIGATTDQEYKKTISQDAALARRFQPLSLGEPTGEETFEILQGLKECYEDFHEIKISDQALLAAIDLSSKYNPERFQPDKSLDLIDEASAMLKIENPAANEKIKKTKNLQKQIEILRGRKEKAVLEENYHEAINIREQIRKLKKNIEAENGQNPDKKSLPLLEASDIQKVLAQKLNIDLSQISLTQSGNLAGLNEKISNIVIGQNGIIEKVVKTLKKSYTGLNAGKRPLASFIFAGPSGCGKTYLAEALSNSLFAGRNNLIRLDMSEFSEQFNISKLIGAPAGYVGYQEENKFTDQVKKKPHSIILLDEVEKAHKSVYNLFLQILDRGQLTDAAGKIISFRQAIIIFTTNLGNSNERIKIGFGGDGKEDSGDNVISEIKKFFLPEFINRLDEILVFNSLDLNNLEKIATMELAKIKDRLEAAGKKMTFSDEIAATLAKQCEKKNARSLLKIIEEKIIEPLTEKIISSADNSLIEITLDGQNINIK
ncbi:MAG TPA: ATP-dependent Clp protease ATP-binding subunit [Candidatus Bipolaricaulota bacterium]|nr:ATP-dependent Clp protease ATP-binding subunit [Candidatus Bipolaricaulota bacterium]